MNLEIIQYFGQHFGWFLASVLFLVLSIFAIKLAISFDINRFIDQRKSRHLHLARSMCPHFCFTGEVKNMTDRSGVVEYESLLQSPPGTILWRCKYCGATFPDVNRAPTARLATYYVDHIDEYCKTMNKVDKHIRKAL